MLYCRECGEISNLRKDECSKCNVPLVALEVRSGQRLVINFLKLLLPLALVGLLAFIFLTEFSTLTIRIVISFSIMAILVTIATLTFITKKREILAQNGLLKDEEN
jgi:hypothetical protein